MSFSWVHVETNAFCVLLQALQLKFSSSRCISVECVECCIHGRTTTVVWRYNLLLFLFLFITRNVRMSRVKASRGWPKCTLTGATVRFFGETSLYASFSFRETGTRPTQNISSHLYFFVFFFTGLFLHTPLLRTSRIISRHLIILAFSF